MKDMPLQAHALVTGASSGIGRAICVELASRGANLVLVSNQEEALYELQQELMRNWSVSAEVLCIDLSQSQAPEEVFTFCQNHQIEVDLLVNNAGVFYFGTLCSMPPQRMATALALHIQCSTRLIQLFAEPMMRRRRGYILNMSSMSLWMPMPGIAVYNATKAYLRNLSISLYHELRPYNIGVTALCPGGINTDLFGLPPKLRKWGVKLGFLMQAEALAKKALKACFKRRKQSIPGLLNHVFIFIMRMIPDCLVSLLMRKLKMYQPLLPPHA